MEGKVLCVDCRHHVLSDINRYPGEFDECAAQTMGGEPNYVTGVVKPTRQSFCENANRDGRCSLFAAKVGVPA